MTLWDRMQQEDKAQHIICAFLAVVVLQPLIGSAWGAAAAFAAGLGKEAWDAGYGTGFCWYDVLANAAGAGLAFMLMPAAL